MTTKWYYAYQEYETEELCDASVLSMKEKLDNQPTEYMRVTPVTFDGNGGWIVPDLQLTDEEILAVRDDGRYNIQSPLTGESLVGVTGATLQAKLIEYRRVYAEQNEVNTKRSVTEITPTNADMSTYVGTS